MTWSQLWSGIFSITLSDAAAALWTKTSSPLFVSLKHSENPSISFVWDPETVVKITLEKLPDESTLVRVNENGKELNEDNLKWALDNSGGWANFLACMKAYLEYGIQLRKGAFEFMRKK